MSLEGDLHVRLGWAGGRCTSVDLHSSRPDVAQSLLQGRSLAQGLAAVPMLFSVCARSQALAAQAAAAAAGFATPGPAAKAPESAERPEPAAQARQGLAAELLREAGAQLLLQAPTWLGEPTDAQALQAARAIHRHLAACPPLLARPMPARASTDEPMEQARHLLPPGLCHASEQALFGMPAEQFLQQPDCASLIRWAAGGTTSAARLLHRWRDAEAGTLASRPLATRLLPARPSAQQFLTWAADMAADPHYCRRPQQDGLPCETGALARQQQHPLVAAWLAAHPQRLTARLVARLVELAALLAGHWQPSAAGLQIRAGEGLGWADNARGLLLHRISLQPTTDLPSATLAGPPTVKQWRILAPTEWNFHPGGALQLSLLHLRADDAGALQALAQRLIQSLDPCVVCRVETFDA